MYLIIAICIFCLFIYLKNEQYHKSAYYQVTKNPFYSVKYDKGKHGEYLTYLSLRHYEAHGCQFLFNLYIPAGNGKTTEIDMLLISPYGIFVFESKNYSGWIFGHEEQKNWTQTLPLGHRQCHKEYFYNPIRQNANHIRHLKALIGKATSVWSIIVFSDRCTLKKVTYKDSFTEVINLRQTRSVVSQICRQSKAIYNKEDIISIYHNLYPYTQASHAVRDQHILNTSL